MDFRADLAEREILQRLDAAVRQQPVLKTLDSIASRVEEKLVQDPKASMAWEVVPLELYGPGLPEVIQSSWVFILRADTVTGAERHPNSHQRMMAYRGSGDFPSWGDGGWRSNLLVSDFDRPLEDRWVSIPPNVWHQAMKPTENWVVVSFHTAASNELIEERGDPLDAESTYQRTYL